MCTSGVAEGIFFVAIEQKESYLRILCVLEVFILEPVRNIPEGDTDVNRAL